MFRSTDLPDPLVRRDHPDRLDPEERPEPTERAPRDLRDPLEPQETRDPLETREPPDLRDPLDPRERREDASIVPTREPRPVIKQKKWQINFSLIEKPNTQKPPPPNATGDQKFSEINKQFDNSRFLIIFCLLWLTVLFPVIQFKSRF